MNRTNEAIEVRLVKDTVRSTKQWIRKTSARPELRTYLVQRIGTANAQFNAHRPFSLKLLVGIFALNTHL